MVLKFGDRVSWKTKCCNITNKKIGEIILILEPGENFYIAVEELKKRYRFDTIYSNGCIRNHKSYMVIVRGNNRRSKLYWPIAGDLKKIYKKSIKKIKNKIESDKDWGKKI